uniref:Mitochondrial putative 39S ribosomal protein L34 n=1 Tax=Acartia pacifica TaxID=335913 RepID=A0A0U2VC69_ACAPC|nr:mitochondrial putative 39S ribosomal protein L34 [Acartia pacifica]
MSLLGRLVNYTFSSSSTLFPTAAASRITFGGILMPPRLGANTAAAINPPTVVAGAGLGGVRTYLKNFHNEKTAVRPPAGWMCKNFGVLGHRKKDLREHVFKVPSEPKRYRKMSWDYRMKTEGGRRLLMRNILEGKRVLASPF